MYGQQQQQGYPRQYGQAYPPQQHAPPYPPQQQHPPQHMPQHQQHQQQQQHPAQQQQQPPGPHGYVRGYGVPAQAAPVPVAAPGPRGMPYGRSGPAPRPAAVSAYESQAQRWKKGFTGPAASGGSGQNSRHSDLEAPLIAELCSSVGSSYPPREVLQKLLRHLPSLDQEFLCELLDDKLDDRVWQVQGKALSVIDALFKSPSGDAFKTHFYYKAHLLEALCHSRKEVLKARAEKVFNVIRSFTPPAEPVSVSDDAQREVQQAQEEESSLLLPPSPLIAPSSPNLLGGSPVLMPRDPPAESSTDAPVSAFGFLNSGVSPAEAPSAPAPSVQVAATPAQSAFSFLSSQLGSTPAPVAPVAPVVSTTLPMDVFSSLPAPTPVSGMILPQEPQKQTEEKEAAQEEVKVHDPIHDAFEGLNFDDDDDGVDAMDVEARANPLHNFSTSNGGTMGSNATLPAPPIKLDANDPIRESILEIDVPAGPMGLVLDRSIENMAVVQGFIPMPTGERGYLELHPVLCPGCVLVSINSMSVEDKSLEEVGGILGALVGSYKVLRFKKMMRNGRIANPANLEIAYQPPPPEVEDKQSDEDEGSDAEDGTDRFTRRLNEYSSQLDEVERKLDELVHRDRANLFIMDMKNQLAQLHGDVEKIQTQGIDAVILGANPPPNADDIKQLRSSLVRRADTLTKRIQKIVTHGTAPSPVITAAASAGVGSPEISAFSFVGGASAAGGMPSLSLPQSAITNATTSAFSFLQSSASPPTSPLAGEGAAAPSAFGFLQNPATIAPATATLPGPVFAGLTLRGNETPGATNPEPASAFSFLSSTPSQQSVASPTSFSFLAGGGAPRVSSPQPSPSAAAAAPAGSAFSFISS